MTFIERREEFRPASGEAPFTLDEVFYSRTDRRGVIQSGNYVFHRVSHYDWDELIGSPHKIIRHPDMPKGVFKLFWQYLGEGKPIGAYVQNKAKDGLNYWVFAIAFPFGDGYMSARFKPTTTQLETVKTLYAALRDRERNEGLSPQDSADALLHSIGELGFSDYDHFATHAFVGEALQRDQLSGNAQFAHLSPLVEMHDAASALAEETNALILDFQGMQTIPHNLRVIASRLEPTGGPISTLSQNYGMMSREIATWFEEHIMGPKSNFTTIRASINESYFMAGMMSVLQECEEDMRRERRCSPKQENAVEEQQLAKLVHHAMSESKTLLQRVHDETTRILTACKSMQRLILGLSSTRVMCKIESARLPTSGDGLTDIILQLKLYQDRITARLDRIEACALTISEAKHNPTGF